MSFKHKNLLYSMFFRVYNVLLMAISETEPGRAPVPRTPEGRFVENVESLVGGFVGEVYPFVPGDQLGTIALKDAWISFSGIRTHVSWSLEKQADVDGRDARPSLNLGLIFKNGRRSNRKTVEILIAVGGRMMDTPEEEQLEPVLVDDTVLPIVGGEEAFAVLKEKMRCVWDSLEDVAGYIPRGREEDTQMELLRLVKERLEERKATEDNSGGERIETRQAKIRRWERNIVEPI